MRDLWEGIFPGYGPEKPESVTFSGYFILKIFAFEFRKFVNEKQKF